MLTFRPKGFVYCATRKSTNRWLSSTTDVVELTLTEKLRLVRQSLKNEKVDAFIVPTDDPHMSEYTSPYFGRREYISGFTGSAGTAVITADKAYLWTDGRCAIFRI